MKFHDVYTQFQNVQDRTIMQMITDSEKENNESLRLLETTI